MAPSPNAGRRCVIITASLVLAKAVILLILFLIVFRVRTPTARLVSTRIAGVTPRLTVFPPSFNLNVTVLLTVVVHNPNPASFTYDSGGRGTLFYRGVKVSDAGVDPGAVPCRSDATVQIALTLRAERFPGEVPQMVADVEKDGTLVLDTTATVPGTVTFFGVFRRDVVARAECQLVYKVAAMRVEIHDCKDQDA